MARKPIKRGRAPIRSMGSKDKRPRSSQMAMNRKVTRQAYESREIEQYKPSRNEQTQANARVMSQLQAGMRPIRASQKSGNPGGDVPPPVDVTYLLSANFNAADYTFSNGEDVNTGAPGSVQVGALTVTNLNGLASVEILGNELSFTDIQPTGGFQEYIMAPTGFTRAIGLSGFFDLSADQVNASSHLMRWQQSASVDNAFREYQIAFNAEGLISFQELGTYNIAGPAYLANTFYPICSMFGGYDSNGVPYKIGDTKANFSNGGAFFVKEGANWILQYRFTRGATPTVYYTSMGYNAPGDIDNLRIPDADLSDLLQPIVLDTFTDVNGTLLQNHTSDVGGPPIKLDEDGYIQNNKAETISTNLARYVYETGKADVLIESLQELATSTAAYMYLRLQDQDNCWGCQVTRDSGEFKIWERVAGLQTTRGTTTTVAVTSAAVRLVAIADGNTISAWADDGNYITFDQITTFQSLTKHGYLILGSANTLDNFAIYPRGTGGEYAELDNYPGEGSTVDPNPVYGRWNAASIAFAESVGGGLTVDEYQINTVTDGTSTVITDIGHITGVHYFEIVCKGTIANAMIGLSDGSSHSSFPGSYSGSLSYWSKNGQIRESGANLGGHPTIAQTTTSVYGVIVDIDAATISWFVDGAAGPQDWSLSLIAAEAGGISNLRPAVGNGSSTDTYEYRINAGQEAFAHPENIPAGCHLGWGIDVPVKAAP